MPEGKFEEGPITRTNIGRFTNAIFAFTLLLLFKNIRTPSFGDYMSYADFEQFGVLQVPDILIFINAFIVIAIIWVVVFHVYNQVSRVDRTYIYLHFLFIMTLVFIPVTSHMSVILSGGDFIYPVIFHLNMLILGLLIVAEWYHVSKKKEIQIPSLDRDQVRCIGIKTVYIPVAAVLGVILASLGVPYTEGIYLFVIIAFLATPYLPFMKGAAPRGCSNGTR